MYHSFSYEAALASSHRAAWTIEEVLPEGALLDFGRPFLPEGLARTDRLGLSQRERLILNHIRGHEYLSIFGLVEEFILPFVLDHARPLLNGDDHRVRALLQFAGEEAKHIHLFRRFHDRFTQGFGTPCAVIGPADAIGAKILGHDPLAVALVILHVEWMTQSHYIESVRGDGAIDPLFASLLRHHWMEEAQHAKLDTLMVEALADERDEAGIMAAIEDYFAIAAFLDDGLEVQAQLNLAAFERAAGRTLLSAEHGAFLARQHQAARWTYLGSGLVHPKFRATIKRIAPTALPRIDAAAAAFA